MSSPALDLYRKHRLAVHDFHRMGETGILPVDGRMELIEGEIIVMAPIGLGALVYGGERSYHRRGFTVYAWDQWG